MFVVIVPVTLTVIYALYKLFPAKIVDVKGLGRWAVVTGSTDGIGKAFTHELAKNGYDIVLVSIDNLESSAKELEDKFNVSTKTVQVDFMSTDEEMYNRIDDELKYLDIGVLVNNVGTYCCHPENFLDIKIHHGYLYQGILNVNLSSMVHMTRIVLPGMVDKGKGLIINISSQASKYPTPMFTLYGATKSFINKFTQDLDIEYRCKGVHVHVLTPGVVATRFSCVKEPSFFEPSADVYVRSALKEVVKKRRSDGYIGHTVVSMVMNTITFFLPSTITSNGILKIISGQKKEKVKFCKQCNSST